VCHRRTVYTAQSNGRACIRIYTLCNITDYDAYAMRDANGGVGPYERNYTATRTNFTSYHRGTCGIYFIRDTYSSAQFYDLQLGMSRKICLLLRLCSAISLFEFLVTQLHFDRTLGLWRRGECRGFVVETGMMWLCVMITHRDRVRADRAKFMFGLVSLMPQLE